LLSHSRLIIVFAAISLVVLTIIYPGGALVFNTNRANNDFEEAIKNLEVDRVVISAEKSSTAETYYKKAAQDFQNLNWFTQIFSDAEKLSAIESFYFVGEKLSRSTNATSKALDTLIKVTSTNSISGEQLEEAIKKIESDTLEAKTQLDLGSSNLSELNQDKLTKALMDDFVEFKRTEKILDQVITELSDST